MDWIHNNKKSFYNGSRPVESVCKSSNHARRSVELLPTIFLLFFRSTLITFSKHKYEGAMKRAEVPVQRKKSARHIGIHGGIYLPPSCSTKRHPAETLYSCQGKRYYQTKNKAETAHIYFPTSLLIIFSTQQDGYFYFSPLKISFSLVFSLKP